MSTKYLFPFAAALLLGCAGAPEQASVLAKNDAVDDYIQVAELEKIEAIRTFEQLHHKVVTDKYIILSDRKNNYLATFRRDCRELHDTEVTPDVRYDRNALRARFDSYRGCRIESLFKISKGQAQELMSLGKAPGE